MQMSFDFFPLKANTSDVVNRSTGIKAKNHSHESGLNVFFKINRSKADEIPQLSLLSAAKGCSAHIFTINLGSWNF